MNPGLRVPNSTHAWDISRASLNFACGTTNDTYTLLGFVSSMLILKICRPASTTAYSSVRVSLPFLPNLLIVIPFDQCVSAPSTVLRLVEQAMWLLATLTAVPACRFSAVISDLAIYASTRSSSSSSTVHPRASRVFRPSSERATVKMELPSTTHTMRLGHLPW